MVDCPSIETQLALMNQTLEEIKDTLSKNDLPGIKIDVNWLKQFFWLLAGTTLSVLVTLVFFIIKFK